MLGRREEADAVPALPPPRPPPALDSAVSTLFRSASTPPSLRGVDDGLIETSDHPYSSSSSSNRRLRPSSALASAPSSAPVVTTHYVPFWTPASLPAPALPLIEQLVASSASPSLQPQQPPPAPPTPPTSRAPAASYARALSQPLPATPSLDRFLPPAPPTPPSSSFEQLFLLPRPLPLTTSFDGEDEGAEADASTPLLAAAPAGSSEVVPPPVSFQTPPPSPPPPLVAKTHVTFHPTDHVITPLEAGGYLDSRDALGIELPTPQLIGGLSVGTRSKDTDLLFLKDLTLRNSKEEKGSDNLRLALQLSEDCDKAQNKDAWELADLIRKPHFKALLSTHDAVTGQAEQPDILWEFQLPEIIDTMSHDDIRLVGIRKLQNEPLGITVQVDENGNLVIARILAGGMIERQGSLHVGDVILEVNGYPVETPEMLQERIAFSKDSVTLKIAPAKEEDNQVVNGTHSTNIASKNGVNSVCFMRALFNYNPMEDTLLPCKEIGLEFQHGDILQIVNQKDPNWWQAKKVGWNGPAGLIPSQELEERRKAFVAPEADYVHKIGICGTRISKKKKKIRYQSKANNDYDKAELLLYEEVTRMPPFKRKTLALIGSQGVGRRTLKNRLINSNPDKFATVIPYTTRPQREYEDNGKSYWFTDRENMEMDIRHHKFLEYGEHNGHLYGTTLDSLRDIINDGKMCVLDCSPAALKVLYNSSEFMPYVIFIAAPGMEQLKTLHNFGRGSRNLTFDRQSSIRFSSQRARTLQSLSIMFGEEDLLRTVEESSCLQRTYEKYIDYVIVNEDHDVTFRKVVEQLETLSTEHQWVPVNWVY